MKENRDNYIDISNQEDIIYLINRIDRGPEFAESFKFAEEKYFVDFLKHLEIDFDEFTKKYFYFDSGRNLHISESEFGYTWISTYGLVAKGKLTNNNFVNACNSQYVVLSLIFDKAIEISESEKVYDVDGYEHGYLSDLTPGAFHNILFYMEVFGKAYLSLCGGDVPHIHELEKIYSLVTDTMHKMNNNNSLFHLYIISEFERVIDYITSIPGDFKEHFVKYDDNPEDGTVIVFNSESLKEIRDIVNMSHDLISSLYYDPDSPIYLTSGLLQKLLDKAGTEKEKQKIIDMYGYLMPEKDETE